MFDHHRPQDLMHKGILRLKVQVSGTLDDSILLETDVCFVTFGVHLMLVYWYAEGLQGEYVSRGIAWGLDQSIELAKQVTQAYEMEEKEWYAEADK